MGKQEFDEALDAASVEHFKNIQGEERTHFGASGAGGYCPREAWYGFRRVENIEFSGRMLRLFNRGHEEEFRVFKWLSAMEGVVIQPFAQKLILEDRGCHDGGVQYTAHDWSRPLAYDETDVTLSPHHVAVAEELFGVKLKQWHFSVDIGDEPVPILDHRGMPAYEKAGHYQGSGDGRISGLDTWFPEVSGLGWGLFENKTHKDDSYKGVVKEGVRKSKYGHWAQMQQYMHFFGLAWGFYVAVNKDTDEIYTEIVMYDEVKAMQLAERSLQIIEQRTAPPRVTNDPSNFGCRFCDFKEICHYNGEMAKNCRSCAFAEPVVGKEWRCNKYRKNIPQEFIKKGCGEWVGVQ